MKTCNFFKMLKLRKLHKFEEDLAEKTGKKVIEKIDEDLNHIKEAEKKDKVYFFKDEILSKTVYESIVTTHNFSPGSKEIAE